MQRNWIAETLRRQLKICRAVAAKPEELQEIARLEEAIESSSQTTAVNFATGPAETVAQEATR